MFLSSVGPRSVTARSSLPLHLPIGVLGKTDRARLGDPLQSRGDIDPIAHQVAVGLLDHVAEMNADAEHRCGDPPAHRRCARPWPFCTSIAQRTASTTLRNSTMTAVAGALDHAAVMHGDGRIDQIAAQRPQAAPGCDPRPRRRAGCSRPHPSKGSPRVFGSRSWRALRSRSVSLLRRPRLAKGFNDRRRLMIAFGHQFNAVLRVELEGLRDRRPRIVDAVRHRAGRREV